MKHLMIFLPLTCFILMQCGRGRTEKTKLELEPKSTKIDSVESATLAVTNEVKRFYVDMVKEDEKVRRAAVDRLTPTKEELIALFKMERYHGLLTKSISTTSRRLQKKARLRSNVVARLSI